MLLLKSMAQPWVQASKHYLLSKLEGEKADYKLHSSILELTALKATACCLSYLSSVTGQLAQEASFCDFSVLYRHTLTRIRALHRYY